MRIPGNNLTALPRYNDDDALNSHSVISDVPPRDVRCFWARQFLPYLSVRTTIELCHSYFIPSRTSINVKIIMYLYKKFQFGRNFLNAILKSRRIDYSSCTDSSVDKYHIVCNATSFRVALRKQAIVFVFDGTTALEIEGK